MLKNIENMLARVIRAFNARKNQRSFLELTRASFTSCFVRSGEKRAGAKPKADRRGLLDGVNDWKLQADYKECQAGFPPVIFSTSERPDIVIWSASARLVILLELTVPAEEGIVAAQLRKQARYQTLLDEIQSRTKWKAVLLTVEIGARGHNPWSARRAFQSLGLTSREASKLLKSLSVVAARCSLAIFLAHKESHWSPKDLVVIETPPIDAMPDPQKSVPTSVPVPVLVDAAEPAVDVLRRHGCLTLFHFTDASNVESIRKHGLLSASSITKQELVSTMNSDELSRNLDQACGLQDYVRLSFNANNPMRFVAVKEKRVTRPVIVVIKLEVVSRSGVLFSDCNATRKDAVISPRPEVVSFDVVKASNQFEVKQSLRHLYQAEVLVPSPLPPEFIVAFRKTRANKRAAAPSCVTTPSRAAPVLQPLDPVAVGRVATDSGSSDPLEEASDTKPLPQAES